MEKYLKAIGEGYGGYAGYLLHEITHPGWNNYFYWLTGISVFFFLMELARPWRKEQPKFRKDFWLDAFYMYFNYFLFSLILFAGLSKLGVAIFNDFIGLFGLENIVAIHIEKWPAWAQILLLFVFADFIQWWTHRLLHRVSWLWEFHKVHHSIEQMGFAGHLRYHWMENFVYKLTQFIPLSMLGFDVADLFALYMFNTVVGHFNHANITVPGWLSGGVFGGIIGLAIGLNAFGINLFTTPAWYWTLATTAGGVAIGSLALGRMMRYIFNSPEMHIWHHAHDMPKHLPYGINFGLTLSVWDWIFRTAHIPHDGRDIRLGFPGIKQFPQSFLGQLFYGLGKKVKS
jgi:sterol desaturase/sphingolipid hydroxylase (fatty acid hydroxylase superfamily)